MPESCRSVCRNECAISPRLFGLTLNSVISCQHGNNGFVAKPAATTQSPMRKQAARGMPRRNRKYCRRAHSWCNQPDTYFTPHVRTKAKPRKPKGSRSDSSGADGSRIRMALALVAKEQSAETCVTGYGLQALIVDTLLSEALGFWPLPSGLLCRGLAPQDPQRATRESKCNT